MPVVPVETTSARYPVIIQPGLLAELPPRLAALPVPCHSVFVVTSPEIWTAWGAVVEASFTAQGVPLHRLDVPAGEWHKRLRTVERLAVAMSRAGACRDALLVALGGGVIGDMTGFLASIYMRGVAYVQVPTTFLAQIDSSVGGKTGVNLASGKNLIGSFHHPRAVFCDPATLATLPAAELRAGLVEAVKAAVLGDAEFFARLERDIDALLAGDLAALTDAIERSVRIKAEIVGADERESGRRMLLNLGHTVGHAIEAATGYRTLLHGEAVAWGMVAALQLAVARAALPVEEAQRVQDLLFRLGPLRRFKATPARLLRLTASDKKHLHGRRRFVLPVAIGRAVVVEDVTEPELAAAIRAMLQVMQERGV